MRNIDNDDGRRYVGMERESGVKINSFDTSQWKIYFGELQQNEEHVDRDIVNELLKYNGR